MRERIRRVLERLIPDPALESAWQQTQSLHEFIGARKIGRTAAAHHPPLEVLQHWADETRHAAAFQTLAVELGGGKAQPYLCGEEAKRYFAELDRSLSDWVQAQYGEAPVLNYLLVTTTIERRAMALYPLYRSVSRHPRVRQELSRIVVEEQSHRVAIEERCRLGLSGRSSDPLAYPLSIEAALFERFWSAIEQRVKPAAEVHLG
jgi:hypothetical protein